MWPRRWWDPFFLIPQDKVGLWLFFLSVTHLRSRRVKGKSKDPVMWTISPSVMFLSPVEPLTAAITPSVTGKYRTIKSIPEDKEAFFTSAERPWEMRRRLDCHRRKEAHSLRFPYAFICTKALWRPREQRSYRSVRGTGNRTAGWAWKKKNVMSYYPPSPLSRCYGNDGASVPKTCLRAAANLRGVGVQNGVWGWGTPRSGCDQEEVPLNKNTMRNLGALLSPTQGHSSRCLLVSHLCLSLAHSWCCCFCFFKKSNFSLSCASSTLNASAPPFRHEQAIIKYLSV